MSRPNYNLPDQRSSSPFDQRPQQGQAVPPPSFKTNVNRNKTRKWTEAKQQNYDGDDWGGFDPYDEYGNYSEAGVPATEPRPQNMRKPSFDKGEERRAFSAGIGPYHGQSQAHPPIQPPFAARPRTASQDGSRVMPKRDFSQPAQVPPPLRSGPPAAVPPSPLEDGPEKDGGKPAPSIPFIRPSDIYKRIEQERERERQSQDSSRPSIESATSRKAGSDPVGPGPATEKDSKTPSPGPKSDSEILEKVNALGKQRDDIPTGSLFSEASGDHSSIAGFQSVVDKAFGRQDDTSVPPTPASTNASPPNEDMFRTTTHSTTGISPIMSRVPSSTTEDSRGRAAAINRDRTMSNITEESQANTAASQGSRQTTPTRSTVAAIGASADSVPGHSRNVSSPSPQASPARTPRLDTSSTLHMSQPHAAEVTETKDSVPISATSEYSKSSYPTSAASERATVPLVGQQVQTMYSPADTSPTCEMQSFAAHGSRSGTPLASPVGGRNSPAPGTVRSLTGKYNGIQEDARRNSQMSLKSKSSFNSWNRSDDPSGKSAESDPASPEPLALPTTATPTDHSGRSEAPPQESFRPHLPGEWVSTTDLPSSTADSAAEHDHERQETPTDNKDDVELNRTPKPISTQDADVDLTPTAKDLGHGTAQDPAAAAKAAGVALGASLAVAAGTSHQSRDFANTKPAEDHPAVTTDEQSKRATGEVLMRPLAFERTASSAGSVTTASVTTENVAPTPPAKDTPGSIPRDTYFDGREARRDSWEQSDDEEDVTESDQLRRDIVRSLTPQGQDHVSPNQASAGENVAREHDTPEQAAAVPAQKSPLRAAHNVSDVPDVAGLESPLADAETSSRPGLLDKRFSWESKPPTPFNPASLGSELEIPKTDLQVANPTSPPVIDITPTVPADKQQDRRVSAISQAPLGDSRSPGSPITVSDVPGIPRDTSPEGTARGLSSSLSTGRDSPVPSADKNIAEEPLPAVPEKTGSQKIPSFREIAQIKSTPERIEKYNDTRKQFAEMNTGLKKWLSTTISANPDLRNAQTHATESTPGLPPSGALRHRQSPSIVRMAKNLGKSDGPLSPGDSSHVPQHGRRTSNALSSHSPQSSVNAEKMQAMGKDFLQSAGKLGGKGLTGAKGWLAKGKQKLRDSSGGGDKVARSESIESETRQSTTVPSADNTSSSTPELGQGSHPTHGKRNSLSWSTKRLSMTLGFSSTRPDKSRSRSRPQSLIVTSQSSTAFQDIDKLAQEAKIAEESPKGIKNEGLGVHHVPSASWVASWDHPNPDPPPLDPPNEAGFRLGVLPSPVNETFSSSTRDSIEGSAVDGSSRRVPVMNNDATSRPRIADGEAKSHSANVTSEEADNYATSNPPEEPGTFDTNASQRDNLQSVTSIVGPPKEPSAYGSQRHAIVENSRSNPAAGVQQMSKEIDENQQSVPSATSHAKQDAPSSQINNTAPLPRTSSPDLVPANQPNDKEAQRNENSGRAPISPLEEKRNLVSAPTRDELSHSAGTVDPVLRVEPIPESSEGNDFAGFDKKDTPMIVSPEFRLEQAPQIVPEENERPSRYLAEPVTPSREDSNSKCSSLMDPRGDITSPPSEASLVSDGTVEKPAKVELVRVASVKVVNNRSSLPSQSRRSSFAKQLPLSPRRELDCVKLQGHKTDSPTLPKHLTPRSSTFPKDMSNSNEKSFTTPGEKDRRAGQSQPRTPKTPQELSAPSTVEAGSVSPEEKRYGIVAGGGSFDVSSMARPEIWQPRRPSGDFVADGPGHSPEQAFTPDLSRFPSVNAHYMQRSPDREARRLYNQQHRGESSHQQEQRQAVSGDVNEADYGTVTRAADQDAYHRDHTEDRLVEMSPLEADMLDRGDDFRRATEQRQQQESSQRQPSRNPSLGPSMVSEPPRSSWGPQSDIPQPSGQQSTPRLLGSLERPSSHVGSLASSIQMSGMTSTMDLDTMGGPTKPNKLVKKSRRQSIQRASSVVSPPPDETKKKRFSGLGSLFGRSKSSAVEPRKGKRLSKQAPAGMNVFGNASPPKQPPVEVKRPLSGADQVALVDDDMHPRSLTPISPRNSIINQSSPSRSNTLSSASYRGLPEDGAYLSPTLPEMYPASRQLHSQRRSRRFSYAHVPEEFQASSGSLREGISPNVEHRLSQAYDHTMPDQTSPGQRTRYDSPLASSPRGQGYPPNRFGSQRPDAIRSPSNISASSSIGSDGAFRRMGSPLPHQMGRQQSTQSMAGGGPPLASRLSSRYYDNGGYYIPEKPGYGRPLSGYRQFSQESYMTGYSGEPPGNFHAPPSNQGVRRSSDQSRSSGYYATGQDSGESQQQARSHIRQSSQELSLPHESMSASALPVKDADPYTSNIRGFSGPNHEPPPPPQRDPALENNGVRSRPMNGGSPQLLSNYSNHGAEFQPPYPPSVRQPGRLRTDFLDQRGGQSGRGTNRDDRAGMQSTSYPGQEWVPAGVQRGNYDWE